MSFQWWFTAPIDAINAIGAAVSALPQQIMTYFVKLLITFLYPLALSMSMLISIYTMLYNFFAPFVNIFIVIGNIPVLLLKTLFILPVPWTYLLYISISISLSIRLYRWAKEIRGWIPFMSGDGS